MRFCHSARAAERAAFVSLAVNQVAVEVEMVVDIGVEGSEFLQAFHLPEPLHRSLSSSER